MISLDPCLYTDWTLHAIPPQYNLFLKGDNLLTTAMDTMVSTHCLFIKQSLARQNQYEKLSACIL